MGAAMMELGGLNRPNELLQPQQQQLIQGLGHNRLLRPAIALAWQNKRQKTDGEGSILSGHNIESSTSSRVGVSPPSLAEAGTDLPTSMGWPCSTPNHFTTTTTTAMQMVGEQGKEGCDGEEEKATRQRGGPTCEDCGNQSKKDCLHNRCRTCCKSRGLDCPTHVRSTWVPAAKRRERQATAQLVAAATFGQPLPRSKRAHSIVMANLTPPTYDDHQDMGGYKNMMMPSEVRTEAVFKSVKVTSVKDGRDEYAYQATVQIGGRVFKGVVTDHGPDYHNQSQFNNSPPQPPINSPTTTTQYTQFAAMMNSHGADATTSTSNVPPRSPGLFYASSTLFGGGRSTGIHGVSSRTKKMEKNQTQKEEEKENHLWEQEEKKKMSEKAGGNIQSRKGERK